MLKTWATGFNGFSGVRLCPCFLCLKPQAVEKFQHVTCEEMCSRHVCPVDTLGLIKSIPVTIFKLSLQNGVHVVTVRDYIFILYIALSWGEGAWVCKECFKASLWLSNLMSRSVNDRIHFQIVYWMFSISVRSVTVTRSSEVGNWTSTPHVPPYKLSWCIEMKCKQNIDVIAVNESDSSSCLLLSYSIFKLTNPSGWCMLWRWAIASFSLNKLQF